MKYMKNIVPINMGARVEVRFEFDRILSTRRLFASWVGDRTFSTLSNIPDNVAELLTAVATVPGVNNHRDGQTHVSGNELSVEVIAIANRPVREIVKTILKRVQRRVAKGERLQMVRLLPRSK